MAAAKAPARKTPAPVKATQGDDLPKIQHLVSRGWQPSEDGKLWFHQRMSRGAFVSLEKAVEVDDQASAPADLAPDVDPSLLGVDVASPEAMLPADVLGIPPENPLDYSNGQEVTRPPEPDAATFERHEQPKTAPPTSAYGGETAEQLAQRADAEAREAAITRNETTDAEFAHDMVGDVSIWTCYNCNVQVRYAPHCTCPRCQGIRIEANTTHRCPFCGDDSPQVDRRG